MEQPPPFLAEAVFCELAIILVGKSSFPANFHHYFD